MYTTELNTFKMVDISYKTHPEWKVIDAVYASCCLPVLFVPHYHYNPHHPEETKDNPLFPRSPDKTFMDGGIIMHFPLNLCLSAGHKADETMAILRESKKEQDDLHPSQTIFEIMCSLILKLIDKIEEPLTQEKIAYTFKIRVSAYSLYTYIYNSIYSENTRKELIQSGVDAVIQ
jgi:predicted acylesterase/phospholipase RssA